MCFARQQKKLPSPSPNSRHLDYDLKPTIKHFEDYVQAARRKDASAIHFELAVEAVERLKQLDLLLTRVAAIQRHVSTGKNLRICDFLLPVEAMPVGLETADEGQVIAEGFLHARLYAETFYYLAFRFRQILTTQNPATGKYAFPNLKSFEAMGVRDVRNHLLEHPEGRTSQVFSQDHSLGGFDGPKLKIDASGTAHVDRGLFVNAAEFKQAVETLLMRLGTNENA
jgi:hypothetical protein